jgi:DNA-binding NarL/FixJ family response regulator
MPSREIPLCAGSPGDGATGAPIRVLIADDHAILRLGLRALIATEPDMEVVGEAVDGTGAVRQARALRPDVIVLDLVMPGKDGIQATAEITQEDPGARILVLTGFPAEEKLVPAVKAGAVGYVLKDAASQDLLQAIRDVAQGVCSLHPQLAHTLMRELRQPAVRPPAALLTDRERQVALPARPGTLQQGDRPRAGPERANRAHPRQPHPAQAESEQPHRGGALRPVCRPGRPRDRVRGSLP